MKKNLFKKSMSVFLTALMLLSCWVFFPGMVPEAKAVSQDVSTVTSYASYHVKLDMTFNSVGNGGDVKILYYPVNADGTLNTNSSQEYILVHSAKKYSTQDWTFDTADDSTRRLSTDTAAENGPVNGWPYGVKMSAASGVTIALKSMYINGVQVISPGYWSVKNGEKEVRYSYKNDSGYSGYLNNWNVPSITVSKAGNTSVQVPSCGTKTTSTVAASMEDQYGYEWPLTYTINGTGATVNQSGNSASVTVSNAALANFTNATGTTNLTLTASGAGRTSTSTVTLTAPKKDVTFENLFSLSDWRYSDSFNSVGSPNEILVENDSTIKIYKSAAGGELTTGSSHPNAHSENRYAMPVTGGKDYTVSFNTTSSVSGGSIAPEIFLFWYDVNNNYLGLSNKMFDGNGDHRVTFTAPETATKAEIRFDNDCTAQGSTLRFNNIAVYRADRAAEIELETWGNRPYTKAYTYKAALGTSFDVPTRAGYAFNGWYLDSNNDGVMDAGEAVTDGNGTVVSNLQSFGVDNHYNLYADWVPADYTLTFDGNGGTAATGSIAYDITGTVTMPNATRASYAFDGWKVTTADGNWVAGETYNVNQQVSGKYGNATLAAQWTKCWTVTFLNGDGSTLATVEVRNGEAAAAPQETPTKAADANGSYTFSSWDKTFSNITGDITVAPQFTTVPHTVTYDLVSVRTCTTNAIVDKRCSGCNYYFFQGQPYDGTTEAAWIALGHDFEGQAAVTNTSDGETGTHEVRCKYYYTESCGGTTRAAHSFDSVISTEGADCVTPGIVTKKCACGETTQVSGDKAPNVHNNTRLINVVAPTCLEDGYTGDTYCDNCNQTVKTGTVDPKLGHSFTNYVYNNDAKCEVDGTETAKCDRCDATDERTKTGSALEHNWTDTEKYLKSAANCTDDEVYYKECSLCGISSESKTGATWTKAGTKWNHKFDGDYVTNNDGTHVQKCTNTGCTATGNKQNCTYGEWTKDNAVTHSHTCTACKYTPAAENHSWSNWKTAEGATGTAAATQTRSCTVCGRTETKACTYTSEHKDATCTTAETTTYTCTECGHGYSVIGEAAKGHDFSGEYKYDSSADTHQQLCANGCGAYGVGTTENAKEPCTWTYTNKEEGKHTAACVCGNSEEQNCSGGTATCTAQAECQYCGEAYGTTAPHSFKGAVKVLGGDVHAYLCEYCNDENIYGVNNEVNKTEACSGGDATCSALAVCEICNDTYGELDTDAHKWGKAAADADNAGKHIYTCEYNNEHKKSEACVSGSTEVVAPTCTDQGYTIQTCKDCSYEWKTDYTDATDHNWVDPVCNNDGTHTLTCNNENADGWVCDETLTLNCAESAITFGLEPATCTEQGYTKYQCTVCNYTWDADFVPATGHSYTKKLRSLDEAYKRSDKTCTEAETYWYRCDNCTVSAGTEADKYADDLASIYWSNGKPSGHDMQKLVDETDLTKNRKSEATCTNPAVYYWSCSVCGEKDETQTFTYMSALDHDYQNIVDEDDLAKNRVSVATCTSAAIYYKSCSRCGDVSNDTFEYGEKTGHKMTKTEAVKETCTTDGNVEYYTCSNCGKKFKDEDGTEEISKVVLPALDHDWESVAFKAASCEEDGHSAYKECSRCGEIKEKTIYKATGHKFTGAYTFDSAIGYHSRYCVNDNCLADGEKAIGMVDAEGNNIKLNITYVDDEAVVVGGEKCEFTSTETDTDENGIHSHKLSCVCGNVTSRAYSDAETFVETVAPTCTENGYDAHKCPDCDATWQKNIVETEGHNLADKATSNGDGTHSVKCTACDYEADAEKCSGGTATCKDKAVCSVCNAEYGETTDHTYDDTKWVYQNDATCTEDGTEKNNCSVCGEEATRTAEDTATGHKMIADYTYDISGWKYIPDDFDEEIKAPTCKDEGLAIIYCEMCSYYKTKTAKTDSTAHVWSDNVTISGNCATGVVETRTCEICGAKKSSPAENQEHKFVLQVSKKATCTEKSIEYYICSVCGFDKETHDNEALGHTWADEIVVDKAPTCKNPGRGYRVCTVCQAKSDFEAIAKLLHAWDQDDDGITDEGFAPSADDFGYIYVEATEAACAKDGYAGYFKCLDCSYDQHRDSRWLAVEGNFTPATGHADIDGDGECDGKGCTKDLSDNSNGDCECICHKDSWFMQIIYKILRFFWKLFKIGKSCDCGHVHY